MEKPLAGIFEVIKCFVIAVVKHLALEEFPKTFDEV
jgi:hypothetical protein